jgi:hypothetical protein
MAAQNRRSSVEVLHWMKRHDLPITRENYIKLAWGSSIPDPWTPDDEAELPNELQDWTQFPPEAQPGD